MNIHARAANLTMTVEILSQKMCRIKPKSGELNRIFTTMPCTVSIGGTQTRNSALFFRYVVRVI